MPVSLPHISTSFHLFTGLKNHHLIHYHCDEIVILKQGYKFLSVFHEPYPTEVLLFMFRQFHEATAVVTLSKPNLC